MSKEGKPGVQVNMEALVEMAMAVLVVQVTSERLYERRLGQRWSGQATYRPQLPRSLPAITRDPNEESTMGIVVVLVVLAIAWGVIANQ
ncbi:hypothetical protein LTR56_004625 [Elasticomyces elasticus]|nr:hypothetical protein LTR56_004625 [Elasticomyces elasticus]KAK3659856.1 hypothetical protein LTR22_008223 [Elasticomyces elasticus]KAK4925965.1 hypothetical protein LTR49_007103 [Elasticomyces elasticus]KAK5768201.1 hypothetical protein LTS12_001685 [Elasticomyces elasticus]